MYEISDSMCNVAVCAVCMFAAATVTRYYDYFVGVARSARVAARGTRNAK